MPTIPTITSQVSARASRTTAGIPSPMSSPEAFGAAGARALGALGGGLADLGTGLYQFEQKRREDDVANRVAQSDFTRRELQMRNEVGADGAGYQTRVLDEYDTFVDEEADKIEDPKTRAEYRRRMQTRRLDVSQRSASYEFGVAAENSNNQINTSLSGLDNRIRLQPDQFGDLLQQGVDVINSSLSIPAIAKVAAVNGWTNSASRSYFEGRLENATDISEIDAVVEDLGKDEWASRLSPQGLDGLMSTAKTARSAFITKADADARAAVDFLEERAKDVTVLIPPAEIVAAQSVVAKSNNPITQARMARIARDQDIVRNNRGLNLEQQRAAIEAGKSTAGYSLPAPVSEGVQLGAQAFGVSASYLAGMVGREYGAQLKGDPNAIDYGVRNMEGTSTAEGVAQIVDGTMIELAASPGVQTVVLLKAGIDLRGMSKPEILALRKNPKVSLLFAAAYAAQNARQLRPVLGRDPTDGELYIAHFMGGGGAAMFLRAMREDPNAVAAELQPKSAAANRSVYYKKDGTPRTLQEVYQVLGASFSGGQTYVAYGDTKTREDILQATQTGIKNDPMSFSEGVGIVGHSDITTPEGMATRGRDAMKVADYYGIPYEDMKPFTEGDAEYLKKQMSDGDADKVLNVLAQVQALGGAMARAGLKQISDANPVLGYAGALAAEGAQPTTAGDIVRGQKRIEDNPDIKKSIGASNDEMYASFLTTTGSALNDIDPKQRQAAFDAAVAHYVETQVSRGRVTSFDDTAFAASVDAVLGGAAGGAAVQEVNGQKTVLPPGVTADKMETAFQRMTLADWVAMSEQRLPPRYADGTLADPRDIEDEAALRSIGPGKYRVALADGSYLITGRGDGAGRYEVYVFTPDPSYLDWVVGREAQGQAGAAPSASPLAGDRSALDATTPPASVIDGTLSLDGYDALVNKYKTTDEKALSDYLNGVAP